MEHRSAKERDMTIERFNPVSKYLGDGAQTAFPLGFPAFGDGRHVTAVISTGSGAGLDARELVYGIDYNVAEVSGGGDCITAAPVPAGHTLTLSLVLPVAQPRDFDNQGRLDAEEIEKGLDYVTALAAQNASVLERALQVPVGDPQSPQDLVQSIFIARNEARAARDEACACRDEACAFADEDRPDAALLLPKALPADAGKVLTVGVTGAFDWQPPEVRSTDIAVLSTDISTLLSQYATLNSVLQALQGQYAGDASKRVKAWATINADGSIKKSAGILSSSRLSLGNYAIVLSSPMPDTGYAVVG
jgi:hypothetical protein